jgi:hypothetical protein
VLPWLDICYDKPGMSYVNLDWANRSAATLTYTACGRREWILTDPEEANWTVGCLTARQGRPFI